MHALPSPVQADRNPVASPRIEKMDIRHLVFDMSVSHDLKANGVYNVARQLAAEQAAAGENARLIFLREEGQAAPTEPSLDLQVLPLEGRKVLGRRVSINADVLQAMTARRSGKTFFHIHTARQPLLLQITSYLRKLSIPYGITVHGRYSHAFDQHNKPAYRLTAFYLQHVERRVLEGARFVQGLNAAECNLIRSIAPRARVEHVSNAAYSSHFEGQPIRPARTSLSSHFPTFGYLGRYEIQHKGLDLLIAGFAAYRNAGGCGVLELAGTGPAREEIAAQAQALGVADYVTIDGPRFGAEKAGALAAWDYFVMPSRFEGVPIGALEAGLAGLPLILSAETGLRDQLVEFRAGLGIEALTPEAVAFAFHRAECCSAEQWSDMSRAAYRMALSVGDWTKIAAQLVALYQDA
jgi:glycosyltransferase involved in cell wall biosynthesis